MINTIRKVSVNKINLEFDHFNQTRERFNIILLAKRNNLIAFGSKPLETFNFMMLTFCEMLNISGEDQKI